MKDLSNIDLNLLKLFAYMYQTESVTATADKLNISQSACSHALQRLRNRLADDLFIRIDNRMLATEYSKRLAKTVLPALSMLSDGLDNAQPFTSDTEHTFCIAINDYTTWCMQPFIAFLNQHYPNIHIEFKQLDERLPQAALANNELDLICALPDQQDSLNSLMSLAWFEDRYVCLRCSKHIVKGDISLATYLQSKHVLVTPWNEIRGVIDKHLSKSRKTRAIAIKTASLLAAPYFIQNTDYLLALPEKYADHMKDQLSLVTCPLPFDMPIYQLHIYWHKTRINDPKINWFINQFSKFYQL
jgi:DNA-binding transcriptional LysR family regulator